MHYKQKIFNRLLDLKDEIITKNQVNSKEVIYFVQRRKKVDTEYTIIEQAIWEEFVDLFISRYLVETGKKNVYRFICDEIILATHEEMKEILLSRFSLKLAVREHTVSEDTADLILKSIDEKINAVKNQHKLERDINEI